MTKLDKKRIGFKPEKGQSQWTRSCQNSGTDKKRRPQQILSVDKLLRQGFKLNKDTGIYEKKTKLKRKDIIIRAVGLDNINEEGNVSGTVYYSCNPEENGDHTYIGFLSKSTNPYGQCMPCCFKKDQFTAKNRQKKDYYMKCIGKAPVVETKVKEKTIGDKLYILQDTNKIQENKVGFLPKYLDLFMNTLLNNQRKIKQHYLLNSPTGYYFKYGSDQSQNSFLNAVAKALNMSIDDLKVKMIEILYKDKSDMIFTSLNNGDIKTSFEEREKYIDFLKNNPNINFDSCNHLISLPKVVTSNGLNIIVFKKNTIIIKKTLEKEKSIDDFTILCQNNEELENLKDPERNTIILIKENKNYNPIVMVKKEDKVTSDFMINKIFKYNKDSNNIVHHIYNFYEHNCTTEVLGNKKVLIAKDLFEKLNKLNNQDYLPKYQKIDARNKCKYIITNNNSILPVASSGSIWNLQIIKHIHSKFESLKEVMNKLNKLDKLIPDIKMKPIGVYYDHKKNDNLTIIGIITEQYELAPVKPETIKIKQLEKMGITRMEYRQLFDIVDMEIEKGKENFKVDDRITNVNLNKYLSEAYELFRLHTSQYLNNPKNSAVMDRIKRILDNTKLSKTDKRHKIKEILFRIVDKNLYNIYDNIQQQKISNQSGGKYNKLVHIISNLPDLTSYEINNNRDVCDLHKSKDQCVDNPHCHWAYDECHFAINQKNIIKFINKISEELVENDHKTAEILQKEGYYVSDIADYNNYKERSGQKIIKSVNNTINKVLTDLFGQGNMPIVGKRRFQKTNQSDVIELNVNHPIDNMGEYYIQKIIENNLSILRAYSNCYVWIKYAYYDIESKNLGYYSNLQTDMANYFMGNIIDWLTNKNNKSKIITDLNNYLETRKKKFIIDFINKITKDLSTNTVGIIEYYVLNQIYKIPVIIYDKTSKIIFIIDDGIIYDESKDNISDKKYNQYKNNTNFKNYIHIRYIELSASLVPSSIEVLYFK
jgi:hypothetical protein